MPKVIPHYLRPPSAPILVVTLYFLPESKVAMAFAVVILIAVSWLLASPHVMLL